MSSNNNNSRGEFIQVDNENFRCKSCSHNKLDVNDWLSDIPRIPVPLDIVEIRFKNTRKGFYRNVNGLNLIKGDVVAVEANPGHDIGVVSATGEMVYFLLKKNSPELNVNGELKKIYRKAKPLDIEKWKSAMDLEFPVMIKARIIVDNLKLNMKVGDVEFQGDKTKAIFYYISDERVDFRELIKILAEEFKIRIEMRQIGARQEAGRIGGIGTCGREMCCSSWVTNFVSVSTGSARYQELSLNPQKLAGQCGKLKCCLNYELVCYVDAQKDFPDKTTILETSQGRAYHQKTDVFKRVMWYSFDPVNAVNITALPVEKVKEIIRLNQSGIKVKNLHDFEEFVAPEPSKMGYKNAAGTESITRFDENTKPRKKKKRPPQRPQHEQKVKS